MYIHTLDTTISIQPWQNTRNRVANGKTTSEFRKGPPLPTTTTTNRKNIFAGKYTLLFCFLVIYSLHNWLWPAQALYCPTNEFKCASKPTPIVLDIPQNRLDDLTAAVTTHNSKWLCS